MFCVPGVDAVEEKVPRVRNSVGWPAGTDADPGRMDMESSGSVVGAMFTVKTALPVTTVPSLLGFLTSAVMTATPLATAVACPGPVMVATALLLVPHVAALVRSIVVPVPVVPMAMN